MQESLTLKWSNKAFLLAGFLFTSTGLWAQNIHVQSKQTNFPIVTEQHYVNGAIEDRDAVVIHLSNLTNPWKVTIKTNNLSMGNIKGYSKPVSDFLWKTSSEYASSSVYNELTRFEREIASGPAVRGAVRIPVDYKILLDWAKDLPHNYQVNIVYTLTLE